MMGKEIKRIMAAGKNRHPVSGRRFAVHAMTGLLVFLLLAASVGAEGPENSYVINLEGEKQVIPLSYSVTDTFSFFNLTVDTLSSPADLFVDKKDQLYVLDSGNGRVLKMQKSGELIQEYRPQGESALKKPSGIYVDEQENIYIADTENGRILVLDKAGKVINTLTQPTSLLYDKSYPFKPVKMEVDSLSQIYVINNLDYHGFTILDLQNNFKGYLAATRLQPDFWANFINLFATKEQKEQFGKRIPPQHTNLSIAEDGSIYTTTANVTAEQMKRYSAVGSNFYPFTGTFGDTSTDYVMEKFGKTVSSPKFVDVCVDPFGIVSLLDNLSGRIYQYDQDGVMIAVFGGTGNWAGRFMNAVAIDNDSQGNLYVLDQNLNTVQVFKPTEFIKKVRDALALYNNGKYIEAGSLWEEILVIDSEYVVAHIGMGKAELKRKNFDISMEHYRKAGDKYGYSQAFAGYLKQITQKYFLAIVLSICALITGLFLLLSALYRKAKKLSRGR